MTSERGTDESVSRFGKSVAKSKDSGANVRQKSKEGDSKFVKVIVFKTLLNEDFAYFKFP
jgi:hypothetical protein